MAEAPPGINSTNSMAKILRQSFESSYKVKYFSRKNGSIHSVTLRCYFNIIFQRINCKRLTLYLYLKRDSLRCSSVVQSINLNISIVYGRGHNSKHVIILSDMDEKGRCWVSRFVYSFFSFIDSLSVPIKALY